jgi:guanidinoacetate N-methyltransferase
MRRIKRFPEFEASLTIHDDSFIRPPHESQRNWVVNRALGEFVEELKHLNVEAANYIAGGSPLTIDDRSQQKLSPEETMEDWQIPVMKAMAEIATVTHGDVLEIGFGRGVASNFLQQFGVRSHTIVECNDSIVQGFEIWKDQQVNKDAIHLLHGKWQDVLESNEDFDAVFFHTYPLDAKEHAEYVVQSETFAAHFFPIAQKCLRPGGIFTYLTNEADSFSRGHQRLLFKYFREVSLSLVAPLEIPEDSRDAMWSDSMVVIGAKK